MAFWHTYSPWSNELSDLLLGLKLLVNVIFRAYSSPKCRLLKVSYVRIERKKFTQKLDQLLVSS